MSIFSRISDGLADWYRGRYVPPPENAPDSPIIIISSGHYEQPLLARILGAIGRFIATEWKWLLGFALAIVGLAAKFL